MTLWCVTCLAACWAGPRHVSEATMVLDGRSVCDDHGRPMIKVIAERMISDEPGNDAGQG
jgi:hypothetical protein